MMTGIQPIEQCRAGTSNVEKPGRTRGETYTNRHKQSKLPAERTLFNSISHPDHTPDPKQAIFLTHWGIDAPFNHVSFQTMQQPFYLLWDIDGTLISGGGAGERALSRAAEQQLGRAVDLRDIDYHGRTDLRIGRMIYDFLGHPVDEEAIKLFAEAYLQALQEEMPRSAEARQLPGVTTLLERLVGDARLRLGLLTGNLDRGARIKLSHLQLDHFFPFGYFANHSEDRNGIAHYALKDLRTTHSPTFPPSRICIIGDTPHDIACARTIGAQTIAIATGQYTQDQLAAHHPDLLLADLNDPEPFLQWLEKTIS